MSACSDDEPLRARRALSPDPIFLLLTKFYNWNRVREDQRYIQCAAGVYTARALMVVTTHRPPVIIIITEFVAFVLGTFSALERGGGGA